MIQESADEIEGDAKFNDGCHQDLELFRKRRRKEWEKVCEIDSIHWQRRE